MASPVYEAILAQARQLTPEEQLELAQALLTSAQQQSRAQPRRSILELRGLGKQIWSGVDAQDYVNRERDSWSG